MNIEEVRRRLEQLRRDLLALADQDSEQEVQGAAIPLMDRAISDALGFIPESLRSAVGVVHPEAIVNPTPIRAADAVITVGQLLAYLPANDDTPQPKAPPPAPDVPTTPDPAAQTDDDATQAPSADAPLQRAMAAVDRRDPHLVQQELDHWLTEGADQVSNRWRKSFMLWLQLRAGSPDALAEMKALVHDGGTLTAPILRNYAYALGDLGEELAASREVTELGADLEPSERFDVDLLAAEMLLAGGDSSSAQARLLDLARNEAAPAQSRVEAFIRVADIHEKHNPTVAVAYREAALELAPSDPRLRFRIAYLYSELGFHAAALFHYERLDATGTATPVALNNLGVELHEVGAPSAGFQMYTRAVDAGSALAAGNLAFIALLSGDAEGAGRWLERGRELDADQPRLLAAASEVKERVEAEATRIDTARREARDVQGMMRLAAAHPVDEPPTGTWQVGDLAIVELRVIDPGCSVGEVGEAGGRLRVECAVRESMIHVTIERGSSYVKKNHGVGAAVADGNIRLMFAGWQGSHEVQFVDMSRVPVQEEQQILPD